VVLKTSCGTDLTTVIFPAYAASICYMTEYFALPFGINFLGRFLDPEMIAEKSEAVKFAKNHKPENRD